MAFLVAIVLYAGFELGFAPQQSVLIFLAVATGGYMALNIGANDVANNMGPAVGGRVLPLTTAIVIAVVCEFSGAVLAGGDVVKTVSKDIISQNDLVSPARFQLLMFAALLAAALWINLATVLSAPVSTTHSVVGGVLGAGIAAAGFGLVNWITISKIAASWVISPFLGAVIAASVLYFIKSRILNVSDRVGAAQKWIPILTGLMAAAFAAYMAMKGLKKVWRPSEMEILACSAACFVAAWLASRPYIAAKIRTIGTRKHDVYGLFDLPLIIGAALLSFAHGANDVANAVGPIAAILSVRESDGVIASQVAVPEWVLVIGAFGIALGLALYGPKLIAVVGKKITKLNSPRAYCVALSAAITVLIATTLGLPVSSTHIAVGAIFGVGFLREYLANSSRRKRRFGRMSDVEGQDTMSAAINCKPRRLARRQFMWSIAAAWIITVPLTALLAAFLFTVFSVLS